MARGKKKESLTPEERLQAALVPESEQPYKVPENWCWVTLQTIDQYRSSNVDPSRQPNTYFELYSVPSSAANYPEIVMGSEIGSTKQSVEKGDVLLCKINPRINRVWKVSQHTENTLLASSEWIIIRSSEMNSNFLMYCFRAPYFRKYMLSNVSGVGGSLMRAQPKYVKTYPVPVPPFAEQQRIVDRIESLFAKLDEAKQKAQEALDSFETRKAAILHKAFTGELTAQWRKDHGVGMECWKTKKLSEVSQLQTGLMKGKHYTGKTVMLPYLRVANVQDGFLNLDEIKEIEVSEEQVERYSLVAGDVLFTEGGDYDKLGRGTVWQGEIENCLHQNHIFVVRPHTDVLNPYFLSYQAGSRYGKQYFLKCSKQTTNLASINSTQLKGFPVLMPTIEEQAQIVSQIDSLLTKEQQAKEAAQGVLEQIDLIKKAILARAFRGQLGTNDPSEERSVEKLQNII